VQVINAWPAGTPFVKTTLTMEAPRSHDGAMVSAPSPTLPADCNGRPLDPVQASTSLERLSPYERLAWAYRSFGEGFAVTTSFGIQSAVLLHMVSRLMQEGGFKIPVIWVDTGYLPPETYRYAEQLSNLLKIEPFVAQAAMSPARMEALLGRLWETGQLEDLQTYHRIRKVDPLDQALAAHGVTCWASGVRATQTDHRRAMALLEPVRQRWALRPVLTWTNRDVYYYMDDNALPQHPLFEQGYSSVGDWHSSSPDDGVVSGRSTRFGGLKQECGIHMPGLMGEGI
jgi:phosphoadenosine phosphosulfate reductase